MSVERAGRAAMSTIRGEPHAQQVLQAVRSGVARPDALAEAIQAVRGDPAALKGLARQVQKALKAQSCASADGGHA